MQIYNTISRKKEEFRPISGNKVNFFACGITVYDSPHLGHAKTYTQFDLIVRYLRHLGYEVYYLQNITDIDDKIIRRAEQGNVEWRELSQKFEKVYLESMASLHINSVTKYARAFGVLKSSSIDKKNCLRNFSTAIFSFGSSRVLLEL